MTDPAYNVRAAREATWRVRVYAADDDTEPQDSWLIENRTESEAASEAAADISAEYPNAGDWTLTEETA